MVKPVTINDVLEGYVALDLECLDRIYLNAYVPNLQVGGQVVSFLTAHLGNPIPSPAIFEKIGTGFRKAVAEFAREDHIPVVRFGKADRKIEVMRPYLDAQARTGRSGVAAIGVAQEFASVFIGTERPASNGIPWFSFTKADRRVTCYYFYLWDVDFGPAFIKICSCFPYPAKIWINGHEWAKRQATQQGLGFTELSNGFATCEDPVALQAICDRLGPGTITRIPGHNLYHLTDDGLTFAIFYTKIHNRVLRPLLATTAPPTPPPLRAALRTIDQHINARLNQARLPQAAA